MKPRKYIQDFHQYFQYLTVEVKWFFDFDYELNKSQLKHLLEWIHQNKFSEK